MSARGVVAAALCLATLGGLAGTGVRPVGDWPEDLGGTWQQREFAGTTRYRAAADDPGTIVATAEASASALYREIEIDLRETPWLQWSWRVDRLPDIAAPETEKAGDDYGARIYVVREGFFGKLSARALNYVWSQRQPRGSRWPNAFTGNAILWSVQQGRERTGEWITHTRNVRADWRAAFGTDIETLHGVALMTDADNSGSRSAARYGRIRFCADPDCSAIRAP
jgi:hypothetical protein